MADGREHPPPQVILEKLPASVEKPVLLCYSIVYGRTLSADRHTGL